MVGLAGTFTMRLPYHLWRRLHLMLMVAVVLGLAHIIAIDGLSASAGLAAAPAMVAMAWRVLRADRGMSARPYEVEAVSHPAHDIAEVTLRPLGAPLTIEPGQFVMGAFFEGPRYRGCGEYHPFTVSGIEQDGSLTVTIKALGDCTRNIQALERGVAARIQGPYGTFLAGRPASPELWIAGGIGITPFMAVLRSHAIKQPTMLIYAFRDARDTAYLEEIESLAKKQPLLRYRPLAMQDDILPIEAVLGTLSDLNARQAYLCGPPPMVAAVIRRLRDRGLPPASIHTESYDLR
jgi:predicted ferric reductase